VARAVQVGGRPRSFRGVGGQAAPPPAPFLATPPTTRGVHLRIPAPAISPHPPTRVSVTSGSNTCGGVRGTAPLAALVGKKARWVGLGGEKRVGWVLATERETVLWVHVDLYLVVLYGLHSDIFYVGNRAAYVLQSVLYVMVWIQNLKKCAPGQM
jgi:hypothetical protein